MNNAPNSEVLVNTAANEMWRKSLTLSAIGAALFFSNIFSFAIQADMQAWHIYLAFIVSALSVLTLLAAGPKRRIVSEAAYILVSLATFLLCVLNNHYLARIGETERLFEGYKIAAIVFALLAHRSWAVGIPLIVACGALPVLQFYTWSPETRALIYGGPFVPTLYATVALFTYLYISRSRAKLESLIQAEMEAIDLRRFAKVMISAKDLSNTPLQILSADIALLRIKPDNLPTSLDRMERACRKLGQLNSIFATYEHALDWGEAETLSSEETLRRETEELTRRAPKRD